MSQYTTMNKNIIDLCERAGFNYQSTNPNVLSNLIQCVVEDCAVAAENHARSFADGNGGTGAKGAADAVRYYGESLLK